MTDKTKKPEQKDDLPPATEHDSDHDTEHDSELLDEALDESFPASDPVAISMPKKAAVKPPARG